MKHIVFTVVLKGLEVNNNEKDCFYYSFKGFGNQNHWMLFLLLFLKNRRQKTMLLLWLLTLLIVVYWVMNTSMRERKTEIAWKCKASPLEGREERLPYIYIYIYICLSLSLHIYIYTHRHVYIYIYIYTHTYIHTYIFIYAIL